MGSIRRVPETGSLGEGELSADHAWRALRRYGGWRLLRDALVRFRYGDGFSHARALGLQLCLAAVPLLIALNGLASKLLGVEHQPGDQGRLRRPSRGHRGRGDHGTRIRRQRRRQPNRQRRRQHPGALDQVAADQHADQ
jgi:hypothetical protein